MRNKEGLYADMIDTIFSILLPIAMAWIIIYTISYGVTVFQDKNPIGGVMIFFVAIAALCGCVGIYVI